MKLNLSICYYKDWVVKCYLYNLFGYLYWQLWPYLCGIVVQMVSARRKLWVQASSIPTRPLIGLWVKCSKSHPLFIIFFFLLFFLFYVTSLNCILILLDNVFGLFGIFFSHRLAQFHCYLVMPIYFYCFVGMTMDFMFSFTWLCTQVWVVKIMYERFLNK